MISDLCFCYYSVRVRVRERLSAPPGHVIGQGPAPGGDVVPCGSGGEWPFARGGGDGGVRARASRAVVAMVAFARELRAKLKKLRVV